MKSAFTKAGEDKFHGIDMRAGAPDLDPRLFIQSVARAFAVLEAFENGGHSLSLGEIAKACGLDKSAVQRLTYTLTRLGYLERAESGPGFSPGKRMLRRSFDYLRNTPLIERATPVLTELRRTARERIDLSLFDDTEIIYAIRMQSKRETFFATLVGRRIPIFCSSGGRAMLARLPDDEVTAILARCDRRPLTPKTIIDLPGIWAKIENARQAGFALAVEEGLIGEVVVAAAVTDDADRPLAAVHIAGSLSEWSPGDFSARFSPLVVEAARAIGK